MPPFYKGFPRTFLLAALVVTGWGQTALAADLGSGPPPLLTAPPSAWTFTFTPYGWLTALDGEITVKGRSVDINVDAFEVLGHLDAAPWMSYSEARRGPPPFTARAFMPSSASTAASPDPFAGLPLVRMPMSTLSKPSSSLAPLTRLPDGAPAAVAASRMPTSSSAAPPSTCWRGPDTGTRTSPSGST